MASDTDVDDVIDTGTGAGGSDNGDANEDGSDNQSQDKEWTPPTKEEWAKTQRALAKANTEAKTRREQLTELRGKSEGDAEKAAREQAEAAEKRYKPVAVRSAAKSAFLEAGLQTVTPERVAKLVRMLDLDSITVDDDGDVVGLDEQVASIKADYPELFTPAEKRLPRLSTGNRPGVDKSVKRTADLIAARALGG